MMKKLLNHPKLVSSLAVAAFCGTIRLAAWLQGRPWTGPAATSAAMAFSLATLFAFTVVAVVERQRSRILAEKRLLIALDAYAEQEFARQRRNRISRFTAVNSTRKN